MSECRQLGQEEWETSHVSIQDMWKLWLHGGRTRTFSPSANSPRQMAHSVVAISTPLDPYAATGNLFSSRFFNPGLSAATVDAAEDSPKPHRIAHRSIELSPSASIKAQSRAESMITMFASKFMSLRYPSPPPPPTWDSSSSRCILGYDRLGGSLSASLGFVCREIRVNEDTSQV